MHQTLVRCTINIFEARQPTAYRAAYWYSASVLSYTKMKRRLYWIDSTRRTDRGAQALMSLSRTSVANSALDTVFAPTRNRTCCEPQQPLCSPEPRQRPRALEIQKVQFMTTRLLASLIHLADFGSKLIPVRVIEIFLLLRLWPFQNLAFINSWLLVELVVAGNQST